LRNGKNKKSINARQQTLVIKVMGSTINHMTFWIAGAMGVKFMKKRQWAGVSLAMFISVVLPGSFRSGNATAQASLDINTLQSNALSQHNAYRSAHRTPALEFSQSLNNSAQKYADQLVAKGVFEHSNTPGIGENLFVLHTTAPGVNVGNLAKHVVKSWYDEVSLYNYNQPDFSHQTGHFTQIVWKDSTNIGCGIAQGKTNIKGTHFNSFYVVCHYNPPGNVMKQFASNVSKP
jgi:glioma pathogenesis-related protein 2